jgi:NTE family protein
MLTFAIEGLPRAGPFRLEEGRRAFRVARESTKRALDRAVEENLLVVSA